MNIFDDMERASANTERLENLVNNMKDNLDLLQEKDIYDLLKQKAAETGAMGTENVSIEVPLHKFDKDINYRESLYWEQYDDVICIIDSAF